jgi:hypothetical protein
LCRRAHGTHERATEDPDDLAGDLVLQGEQVPRAGRDALRPASPQYARARAGLAFSLLFLSHRGRATTDNAGRAIDTALAIDPTLPDAHAA